MRFELFKMSLILCLALNYSCASNKQVISKTISLQLPSIKDNGLSLTLTPQSELVVQQDDSKINHITQNKGQNLILKFESIKKTPKNIADGGYREVLFIEIPNQKQHINLADLKDTKINIWFARFCFCRDYIGFHKIEEGQLDIDLSKNTLKIKATIKFNNLPQVLNFIGQDIHINP
ncbi:MAG: hypothetical protein HQ471_04915 [Flavobacteriales bacterium]|jgi:hypothetical protein|nr:hypothetical protein [Flavobacteriales bacterium]